jgi:hypothetical protein
VKTRGFVWVAAALVFLACETRTTVSAPPPAPPPSPPVAVAPSAPETPGAEIEAARGLLDELALAWQSGDVETVRRLHAPTATVRIETGQSSRTLSLDEYIRLAVQSRAMLADYRYRVEESRFSAENGGVTAHVNVIEDGREGERVVHSEADVTYTIETVDGRPLVSSTIARVVTATPETAEGWDKTPDIPDLEGSPAPPVSGTAPAL